MTIENETTVVPEAPAAVEPTTTPAEEIVPSQEVKTEVQPTVEEPVVAQVDNVDNAKMQDQINNLNTALKQERESSKVKSEEFKDQLAGSKETIDKLKNVFSPEVAKEEVTEAVSMDKITALLDERENKKREDDAREKQAKKIKEEVTELETEWSGAEGKPKYDDKKVLDWQDANRKLHLSPKEAFNEMNRDTIMDWEIKNRLNKKPEVQNVETPAGTPVSREPVEMKPKSTEDLRSAVLEAMDAASDENIN